MATTKIWKIVSNFDCTIKYVKNGQKTTAVLVTAEGGEVGSVNDVLCYASRSDKVLRHDGATVKEYVTGINCCKDTAYQEFLYTKIKFAKTDKILAWHGYQSFKPGETTPEEAHQIGIELASALWGDRFQVVVTTHLDRGHLHNHFVVNSVSFIDGYKYYGNKATYFKMREESDRICAEHGLSVVENPKYNGVSRGEYRALQEGRYNIGDIVKEDIDRIIMCSGNFNDFILNMKKSGYTIDASGKYLTVTPYKRKAIRIERRWGAEYSTDGIAARIAANRANGTVRAYIPKIYNVKGTVPRPGNKLTGYRALYVRYLFMLGKIPAKKGMTTRQMHFLMREDLLKLDTLKAEMKFMREHDISSEFSLKKVKSMYAADFKSLNDKRTALRSRIRRAPAEKKKSLQDDLQSLNKEIKITRTKLFYCNDIIDRSKQMKEKMNIVKSLNLENERSAENGRITGS